MYKGAEVSFFFFQVVVGIRYLYVTGVQTCALPICRIDVGGDGVDAARERRPGKRVGTEGRLAARLDARDVGLRQVGDDPGLVGRQAAALAPTAEGRERL